MSFFDSDVVRAEMAEISELQEDVYRNVFKFPSMNKEEKMFHVAQCFHDGYNLVKDLLVTPRLGFTTKVIQNADGPCESNLFGLLFPRLCCENHEDRLTRIEYSVVL